MTFITLNQSGGRYLVEAVGHAEGSVQACAAVSFLMYSLLGYLANADGVEIESEDIADAFFSIEFSGGDAARIMFDYCVIAFLQLEGSYGEFVSVKRKKDVDRNQRL